MADETLIDELVLLFEDLKAKGTQVSPEKLCADHGRPDLVESLKREIRAIALPAFLGPDTSSQSYFLAEAKKPTTGDLNRALLQSDTEVRGYRLVERLGGGGYGEVWKAEAPGGFQVALKFVRIGEFAGEAELGALSIIRGLSHPNLLSTFGAWADGDQLIIAMELADRTLMDRFREVTAQGLAGIPREELLDYLQEAAQAIDYLNTRQHSLDGREHVGIQHRDIKPQNILLKGRAIRLADFGLARLLEHSFASHTGAMTPAYAAPEFITGKTSHRSDQYSLAITYCQMRGGRLPFTGEHHFQLMRAHIESEPDLTMLPPEERPVVAKALERDPEKRFPTCGAFVKALRNPQEFAQRLSSQKHVASAVERFAARIEQAFAFTLYWVKLGIVYFFTLSRGVSGIVGGYSAIQGRFTLAGLCYAYGLITDFVDGLLARKFHVASRPGEITDGACDFIFEFFAIAGYLLGTIIDGRWLLGAGVAGGTSIAYVASRWLWGRRSGMFKIRFGCHRAIVLGVFIGFEIEGLAPWVYWVGGVILLAGLLYELGIIDRHRDRFWRDKTIEPPKTDGLAFFPRLWVLCIDNNVHWGVVLTVLVVAGFWALLYVGIDPEFLERSLQEAGILGSGDQ